MNRGETGAAIEFVPSRVEGMSYVRQVRVHSDRLELFSAGRWISYPFLSFAPGREIKGGFIPIGRLWFSRIEYTDSYFEFFTKPAIRIYMPTDGPIQYPDSHFSRIQQLIRSGGFKFLDEYQKQLRYVLRASPLKTTLYILAVLVFSWLFALSVFFPGKAGRTMRDTLFSNVRNPDINLSYVLPMLIIPSLLTMYHGRNKRAIVLMIGVGFGIALFSEAALGMLINPIIPPGVAANQDPMWSKRWLVTLLMMCTMSGLIGAVWRSAFMEPLVRPGRSSGVNLNSGN